jgi:outer membrane protein assembly factor BamA
MFNPMFRFRGKRNRLEFSIGPFYHSYELDDDTPDFTLVRNTAGIPDRIFNEQPFGGFKAHFKADNLAIPLMADNGIKYDLYASQSWNLKDEDLSTLKLGGQFSFYRMITKGVNFATRISFEHNNGSPEYYQLASLGGRTTYRAARADRYRGNSMFVHNIDLRFLGFSLGRKEAPTVAGFILGMDYGRVWLDGEDSDIWHVGYGGGLWVAPLGATILSLTYFQDSKQKRIAFAAGFPF